jgi:uncharacterized protein (TIGR02757 family)
VARLPATRISAKRAMLLRERFLLLQTGAISGPDPIDFVHRYDDAADREVAGLFASGLAFGRVASFWPVLDALFEQADQRGGPAQWVETFNEHDAKQLQPLFYRWIRGPDFSRFAHTIGRIRREHGSVGNLFLAHYQPTDPDIGSSLGAVIDAFRAASVDHPQQNFSELPRGYRYFLPHPTSGSACKRWSMLLRWMVRSQAPDIGQWALPQNKLVIPLDTHIHRIAKFVGLTRRNDGSWKTATEITNNLKKLDPDDPIRFDFILAHLGISGSCKGQRIEQICTACMLLPVCKTGQAG